METIVRVLVIYLFILIGMKVLGKREFGQLSPQEFVVLLIIPEMVSSSLNQNDTSLTNAILATSTLLSLVFITSTLSHRFKAVESIVAGTPTVLVYKGQLNEDVLNKERISPEEVLSEARQAGLEKVEQIRWAILESDGQISIVPEK